VFEESGAVFFFVLFLTGFDVRLTEFEEAVDDLGELVGGGGDSLGGAAAGRNAAEESAQGGGGAMQGGGGAAEHDAGAVDDDAGVTFENGATGDAMLRTEAQPGGEVFFGFPFGHVQADFADDDLGAQDAQARDDSEVDAAHLIERRTHLGQGVGSFLLAGFGRGQGVLDRINFWFKSGQDIFDGLVTGGDLALVKLIAFEGLTEAEEMFGAPVADQGLGDLVAGTFNLVLFECGQLVGVALAGENGLEDGQAGDAGDIADDVVQGEVHLLEGLLEVQHVAGGGAAVVVAQAQIGTQDTDVIAGPEGGGEQAVGVELLEPLAVAHIGFAAGEVFDVSGVDEFDGQAGAFEDLKEGNPINAGGFHDHGIDAAGLEPVGQGVEIGGEGGKDADGFGVAVSGHTDVMLGGADVDAGGVEVELLEELRGGLILAFAFGAGWGFHKVVKWRGSSGPAGCVGNLLNGITAPTKTVVGVASPR